MSAVAPVSAAASAGLPDIKVSVRKLFGFDSDMEVPAYSTADEHVPDLDPDYLFDKPTTLETAFAPARGKGAEAALHTADYGNNAGNGWTGS